jgi:hypothetical protein
LPNCAALHIAPSIWATLSAQTQLAPLRPKMPDRHGWPAFVVHAVPRLHCTHEPAPSQNPPAQAAPAPIGIVVSTHTCVPVAQEKTPCLHGVGFVVQVPPCEQATHMPAELQTLFVPHAAPAPSDIVVSLHTTAPVEQSVMPATHAVGFVEHAAFCMHAMHAPLGLHTLPVPHPAPAPLG